MAKAVKATQDMFDSVAAEVQHAVARSGDPQTSWDAAHSITSDKIRKSQAAVLKVIRDYGPMNDSTLLQAYRSIYRTEEFPQQSESGLRTRRSELVEKGLVYATGKLAVMPSGRSSIIWAAR